MTGRRHARSIADRGYDSETLRLELAGRGIDLIAHNRRGPGKTQDGRKLRRSRRRWIIERTMAWLENSRRLVVRYEHRVDIDLAFFHVACLMIALNR